MRLCAWVYPRTLLDDVVVEERGIGKRRRDFMEVGLDGR